MLYCLDTNIIIDIVRENKLTIEKLKKINSKNFCINPIIISELFKGAYLSNNPQTSIALFEELVKGLEILNFTKETYHFYGKIYTELKKIGKPIQELDLFIGCLTLSNNATLITKNYKDFSNIKGLKILAI